MPAGAEQDLATRAVAAVGVRCDAVEMEYLRQGFKVADVAAVMPTLRREVSALLAAQNEQRCPPEWPLPATLRPGQAWECRDCGESNYADRTRCRQCCCEREPLVTVWTQEGVRPAALDPRDWVCDRCSSRRASWALRQPHPLRR